MKRNRGVTTFDLLVGLTIMSTMTIVIIGCTKNGPRPEPTKDEPAQVTQAAKSVIGTLGEMGDSNDLGDGEIVKVSGKCETKGVHCVYLQSEGSRGIRVHALEKGEVVSQGRTYQVKAVSSTENGTNVTKKILVLVSVPSPEAASNAVSK
jgi:hypothetical protein